MANIPRLTDIEISIMKTLWEHHEGLTIQEITSCLAVNEEKKKISAASVAQAVKHLKLKEAVIVSDYVQVSNVYARKFCANFSQEEYITAEFQRLQKTVFGNHKRNSVSFTASFLESIREEKLDLEEIEEIEKIISEKKKKIMKKEK